MIVIREFTDSSQSDVMDGLPPWTAFKQRGRTRVSESSRTLLVFWLRLSTLHVLHSIRSD